MLDLTNEYIQISILAIVQGLTEFLPVSSSGHLVLAPKLLGFTDPGLAIDAFLHLGTLLAAVIYFREDIYLMTKSLLLSIPGLTGDSDSHKKDSIIMSIHRRLALGIILGSIPAVLLGLTAKDFFETEYIRSVEFVSYMLIAGAVLMLVSEQFFAKEKTISSLTKKRMFFVGLMQSLALLPGMSRSGSTIAGALFMGLKKDEAARFSFLLGLPVIAGAGLLAIKDMFSDGLGADLNLMALALGFLLSFVSGYLAIDFLLKFLKKQSLTWFVVYRVLLALVLLFGFN
jgi:undecaprenyl-diphosphatase